MNSLQTRLLLGIAIVFAVGFLLASVAIYGFSKASMHAEFDEALFATAQALSNLTAETDDGIEFEFSEGFEEFSRIDAPSYYQFWLDGQALARSAHLRGCDLEFEHGTPGRPMYRAVRLPDGRSGRQICMTFHPKLDDWDDDWDDDDDDWDEESSRFNFSSSEVTVTRSEQDASDRGRISSKDSGVMTLSWERPKPNVAIAVARATTEIDRRLASLMWILPVVGLSITLLSSAVLVFVVRNGLQPVQTVTKAITAIDENSLAARIPTARVPVEISPMVGRLNDLLVRLEKAFHREREFSSNLAHELRTPLAGLRSTLEVYRTRRHEPEEYDQAIATCLEICDQSENLVENLLSLARVEASTFECSAENVDVQRLFDECWQPFFEQAREKGLDTAFEVPKISISTDREMLRVILRNVLSNAVHHSDEGGQVHAHLSSTDNEFSIAVSNTGNQLSKQQATLAFDRLWRGDQARGHTGERFGLGLTLIKRFAEALGGSVKVTVNRSFHICITLPV